MKKSVNIKKSKSGAKAKKPLKKSGGKMKGIGYC